MTDGNAVRTPSSTRILLVGSDERLATARSTLQEELDEVTLLTQPGPGTATGFVQESGRRPDAAVDAVVLDAAALDDEPAVLVQSVADAVERTPLYVVLDESDGFDAADALDNGATDVVRYSLTGRSVFATRLRDAISRESPAAAGRGRPVDDESRSKVDDESRSNPDDRTRTSDVDADVADAGAASDVGAGTTSDERTEGVSDELDASEPADRLTRSRRDSDSRDADHRDREGATTLPPAPSDALVRNVDRIRAVENELVQADSRDAVEQAVCERVTELDGMAFAWFGAAESQLGTVAPRAWSGDGEYLGRVSVDPTGDPDPTAPPAARTLVSGTITAVPTLVPGTSDVDVGGEWRDVAVECGYRSALSIPVAFDGVHHGILTVYGDEPGVFQDGAGTVVRELATTAAYALDAFEERESLSATSTLVVECCASAPQTFLPLLATAVDADVRLDQLYQCEDRTHAFFAVPSGRATAIERFAIQDPSVVASQTLPADDERVAVVTRDPILETVASEGGRVRDFDERDDGVHFTVELSTDVDVDRVQSLFNSGGDDVSVLARRHVDGERGHEAGFAAAIERRLSSTDYEALRTAHAAGFFDRTRPTGTSTVGDLLDESVQETEHRLRRAEAHVFDVLFER